MVSNYFENIFGSEIQTLLDDIELSRELWQMKTHYTEAFILNAGKGSVVPRGLDDYLLFDKWYGWEATFLLAGFDPTYFGSSDGEWANLATIDKSFIHRLDGLSYSELDEFCIYWSVYDSNISGRLCHALGTMRTTFEMNIGFYQKLISRSKLAESATPKDYIEYALLKEQTIPWLPYVVERFPHLLPSDYAKKQPIIESEIAPQAKVKDFIRALARLKFPDTPETNLVSTISRALDKQGELNISSRTIRKYLNK
jgi:hypothetical protein